MMTDKTVEITVELLDILAIATKETKRSRTSKLVRHLMSLNIDMGSEKYLKMAERTDLEDGMKKLERLTNQWVVLASVLLPRWLTRKREATSEAR